MVKPIVRSFFSMVRRKFGQGDVEVSSGDEDTPETIPSSEFLPPFSVNVRSGGPMMQFEQIDSLIDALRVASKLVKSVDEERVVITDAAGKWVE
tara:strand:- start:8631 stop:8912 length:282 start_codon:yes stop_codon:yes gene_type:complete